MSNMQEHAFLVCPVHKSPLGVNPNQPVLTCVKCSIHFPHNNQLLGVEFSSFAAVEEAEIKRNASLYDAETLNERYQNFLNWLFQTFKIDEASFRQQIFRCFELSEDMNILITSVGNGDDIINLIKAYPGLNLNIYAQDISSAMCEFTLKRLSALGIAIRELNISNLSSLPYKTNFFDLVFHFGGINWIANREMALTEMVRVCKDYGQIGIIDESVGSWLRNSDYGKMMIQNNALWSAEVPLDILPVNINQVKLEFILENCFYYLSFIKDPDFPNVDLDIRHIGPRGGSIRTRYFGQIEGINPTLAEAVRKVSQDQNISQVDWLEMTLRNALENQNEVE